MYREFVAFAKSVHRLSKTIPALLLANLLGRFSGQMTKMIMDCSGLRASDFCVRLDNDLSFSVFDYALNTSAYLDARRRGFDISAVRYEDLVARPLDMCRVILEFCRLPVSLAELAVEALDRDSQRNTVFAKSFTGRVKDPVLTPEKKAYLNEQLNKYGLPLIGEPNVLEGTFSCS